MRYGSCSLPSASSESKAPKPFSHAMRGFPQRIQMSRNRYSRPIGSMVQSSRWYRAAGLAHLVEARVRLEAADIALLADSLVAVPITTMSWVFFGVRCHEAVLPARRLDLSCYASFCPP